MDKRVFDMRNVDIAWCPACGNFAILDIIKQILTELEINPLAIVSGIGQAGKIPHYFKTNVFHGLHGRALPVAKILKKAITHKGFSVVDILQPCVSFNKDENTFFGQFKKNTDIYAGMRYSFVVR